MKLRKLLVVNADDLGFTPDVNTGIVEAHREGIVTAATLMANGEAFADAVRLARETPSLDVGCHLVLVGGRSLVSGKELPATAARLVAALARREIHAYNELRAQVEKILAAGIQPTHLDTHKHTHIAPPVMDALARLGDEFGIRWIRRPLVFESRFRRLLEKYHCRATGRFVGFRLTGKMRVPELIAQLEAIPEGTTELMCHPGRCGDALRCAPTRLKESREEELRALTAPEVREAIRRAGIELVGYSQIS